MAPQPGVKVIGLKEFRQALKQSADANPRELTKVLKDAGSVIPPRIQRHAPRASGELAGSVGRVQASGTKGRIPIKARHATFAEFQKKGAYGATMSSRYGGTPRFGYRAVEESVNEVTDRIYDGMEQIITIHGWAR